MQRVTPAAKIFATIFGIFLGLALLKFGTPAVLDKLVALPENTYEWLLGVWPLRVAYGLAIVIGLSALAVSRRRAAIPLWLLVLPLAWFAWQFISAAQSLDGQLSRSLLAYFGVCIGCFYIGVFCLRHQDGHGFLLGPLLVAFGLMVSAGFNQHFGGLEETRQYFWTYIYPTASNVPPEYIQKMRSDRIFATVFYPNALAGALLLLLPPLLAWVWQAKKQFTQAARMFLCASLGAGALACLYWSGSKGGWLLALLVGFVVLLHQKFTRRMKLTLVLILLVAGGMGFYWKNRAYMDRGATSVVARFDYWRAAWQTAISKPIFGSGPGTFAIAYQAIKKPESEMARLTHNDYLQQASDSGFPGLMTYTTFVGGVLCVTYRRLDWKNSPVAAGLWVGLAAWAVQSGFEFTLYVPALGWTAFGLMGWLLGGTPETIRQNTAAATNL